MKMKTTILTILRRKEKQLTLNAFKLETNYQLMQLIKAVNKFLTTSQLLILLVVFLNNVCLLDRTATEILSFSQNPMTILSLILSGIIFQFPPWIKLKPA